MTDQEHSNIPQFGEPGYGLTRTLTDVSYADGVKRAREALAEHGFGVLTEIDVKATLDEKIGAKTRDYIILGACNPKLAHRALQAEPGIGLLLPCNVVVSADDGGHAVVSAIDPVAMFTVVGRDDVEPLAKEVRDLLEKTLGSL
jgi:uncharacterized protein (DUF302 family)